METGGVEYALSLADTKQLALRMKEQHGRSFIADGELPPGGSGDAGLEGRQLPTPVGILDGESRVRITDPGYPWSTMGYYNSGSSGVCTVFRMINIYTAITAGHCFIDSQGNWKARGTILFGAGLTQSQPVTVPSWCYDRTVVGGFTDGNLADDYAVIRLRSATANCPLNSYTNTGTLGYQTVGVCTTGLNLNTAGYPSKNPSWGAAPPGSWIQPSLFHDYRGGGSTGCLTQPSGLFYRNDFSPGMSGGPVWRISGTAHYVRGIQLGIEWGITGNENRARKLDSTVVNFMLANAGY